MSFTTKLKNAISSTGSVLCVGLDPVPEYIPKPLKAAFREDDKLILDFCRRIIEATKPYACAYKPNTAFFEAMGSKGWAVLEKVADMVPSNRILIIDAKRGDIGHTALQYKLAFFEHMSADAITLNPLMGMETIDPFLDDPEKAVFVLAMTSNRGAADLLQRRFEGRLSLGEYIAEELAKKMSKSSSHLGLVTGATQTDWIRPVLKAFPEAHLLIPGVGKQGGNIEDLAEILKDHKGLPVINSSRSVIYAGGDSEDWMEKVSVKAALLKESLNVITKEYV
ncbi:MAG: orotidine-5'-phosphate decarboxylase [Balneolaceae bacterium]|nr:MAG: orotidine-5'-phosphate decarboxylase [Balneolaceae bacterium]